MSFENWLNMYVDSFQDGLVKRRVCIKRFTKALWTFIISKGYTWKITEKHLKNCIASGLYDNRGKSHITSEWNYSNVNTEYSDDDLNHFLFVLDSYSWESFWAKHRSWGDLDENEFRGYDRCQDIEAFIWKQIDIDSSPQTQELYEYLLAGEEDIAQSPFVDTYLQEAVEYNGWGGLRR